MVNHYPNTITFYDYTVRKSGDEVLAYEATVKADIEPFIGTAQTNYSTETIGTVNATIPPNDSYYQANDGRIQGKLAQTGLYQTNDESWYRVTEVRPAISAYTNKVDFIDLVLEKVEAPDASSL